ncbi:hypothetical protein [Lactococcus petauri]|uniref:hypothetical protein n=2 Tax=Lactococcus TaxID=1357 RepID=UPI00068FE6B5
MEDCIICNEQTKDNICDKCYKEAMKEKTEFIKHLLLDGFYKKEDKKPELSIPKKIAEMLDVSFDFQPEYHEDISWIASNMDVLSDDFHYNEFYTWLDSGKDNYNIALAYLAGKAIGVELVEVEG